MSNLRTQPVGKLVEPVASWNPLKADPDDEFDYIDLSAVDQKFKTIIAARKVTCGDAPSRARQIVSTDDVLVSTVRPNLNGVARVPAELDQATASTGFCVLRPQPNSLSSSYLFHWVKSPQFVADMIRKATGASYPAVSDKIIFESLIPIPSFSEQIRIGAILDQADVLRVKRSEALAQLDSLTQSIFIEMFGDPATNPKGWPYKSLIGLGKVVTGGTPPSSKPGMFEGPIPFVTPGDLESDEPVKRSLTTEGAKESRTVRAGSTLVCCIGATIGKMGIAQVQSAFNQQLNAVEWTGEIDDLYGYAVLRFFKPTIRTWGASTTLPILKKSSFEKIEIPVPPLTLQRAFAQRFNAAERLRVMHKSSLAELDELFASLQKRAFKGYL